MQYLLPPRTFVLGALIIASFIGHVSRAEAATVQSYTPAISVAGIISKTNDARAEAGLAPLATSTLLISSSQMKANDMMARQYFSHTAPNGARFWTLIDAVGYTYAHAGENLALGYSTSDAVVTAWLNSPSHRANILDPKFAEIGIGLVFGEYNGVKQWFIVQHFGSTTHKAF